MNFVMFPMFFFSSALYPLWRLREGGSEILYYASLGNPFTYAVELIRFALYGEISVVAALVVTGATVLFFLLAVLGYDPARPDQARCGCAAGVEDITPRHGRAQPFKERRRFARLCPGHLDQDAQYHHKRDARHIGRA